MVAGGNPDRGHHLLRHHHVLPVGQLPPAVWRDTVYRVPADRRMADPLLGLLLVVALPDQLRTALHHDTGRFGHGHRHAAHPQLDDHSTGRRRRIWTIVLPGQLADIRTDAPAA